MQQEPLRILLLDRDPTRRYGLRKRLEAETWLPMAITSVGRAVEIVPTADPCFDVAFCLNHFVLKAIHLPDVRRDLLANALVFWAAYAAHISWEDDRQLEARVCALLPALLLARIDGKSPVEYLDEPERELVRSIALNLLAANETGLGILLENLASQIEVAQA